MRQVRVAVAMGAAVCLAATAMTASFFDVLPAVEHDRAVPTLGDVVGHGWGEEISTPEQIADYAAALATAAPDRILVKEYARSLEGRPLLLLAVSSPGNLARLDVIRAGLARLGDPRGLDAAERQRLVHSLPAVIWVASLGARRRDVGWRRRYGARLPPAGRPRPNGALLEHVVILIDPMQNPDGRARFVGSTRQARGIEADPEPSSAEHDQPWPGGRVSHDLFDLNRDWFALTHPESAGRIEAMLEWHPMVLIDLHEMGADMGYFFAPPARPFNPLVSAEQVALWDVIGRANAAAFDAHGWRYWTREIFDAFYPGYGETWPLFTGAVGMTFEQASSRGLATRLKDGTPLRYVETVQHHLIAAYTTCRTAAGQRARFRRRGSSSALLRWSRAGAVRAAPTCWRRVATRCAPGRSPTSWRGWESRCSAPPSREARPRPAPTSCRSTSRSAGWRRCCWRSTCRWAKRSRRSSSGAPRSGCLTRSTTSPRGRSGLSGACR